MNLMAIDGVVTLCWGSFEVKSTRVPKDDELVWSMEKGIQDGWLKVSEDGELLYGKAHLGMFPPIPGAGIASLSGELSRRPVAEETGLGCAIRNGVWKVFVARDPHAPAHYFPPLGFPTRGEAERMRDVLCSALVGSAGSLNLSVGRASNGFLWGAVEAWGDNPWHSEEARKTIEAFDIRDTRDQVFEFARMLTWCRGTYRWTFEESALNRGRPSRYDREPGV